MNSINSAYNYSDLAGLNAITKQSNSDEAGALKEVARQFESMFVGMMLKSMREANSVFEEGNPLNSNESKFYRQMFDDQLALSLTKGKGMGLADTLYRQMKSQFDIKEAISEEPNTLKADKTFYINKQSNPFLSPVTIISPKQDTPQLDVKPLAFEKNITIESTPAHSIKTGVTQLISSPSNHLIELSKPINMNNLSEVNEKPKSLLKASEQSNGPVIKQAGFKTPQEFVSTLWPIAQKVADEMGVEPKAIVAQAALETGWGKHIIHHQNGNNSHNLFGIKADKRWNGEVAKVSTLEYRNGLAKKEVAPFRVYDSYESSLKDYARFIKDGERYQHAVKEGRSIKGYSEGLQKAGYATDPEYAKKIQRIAGGTVLNSAINQIKQG